MFNDIYRNITLNIPSYYIFSRSDDGAAVYKDFGEVTMLVFNRYKYNLGVMIEIETKSKKFVSIIFENSALYEETLKLKTGESIMFKGVYDNNYFNSFDFQRY